LLNPVVKTEQETDNLLTLYLSSLQELYNVTKSLLHVCLGVAEAVATECSIPKPNVDVSMIYKI